MKIKILSISVLSSLFLVACGGGNDSYVTPNNPDLTNESEWYLYETSHDRNSKSLFSKLKITLKDNKGYVNGEYDAYGSTDVDYSDFLKIYLTEDGVYNISDIKTSLGYEFGTFSTKPNSSWTYSPYSSYKLNNLKITQKFETVRLSGQPMSPYIDGLSHFYGSDPVINSGQNTFPKYYVQKLQGKNFPEGATCLRVIGAASNQSYFDIYGTKPLKNFNPEYYFQDGYSSYALDDLNVYISDESYENQPTEAVIKIQSNFYEADFYKKGDYFTLDTQIKLYQKDYEYAVTRYGKNSKEAHEENAFLQGLKSECSLFNKVASNAIDIAR